MTRIATFVAVFSAFAGAELRPESELTHSCFDFPSTTFHRQNSVKSTYATSPHTAGGLNVGDAAFDFTLNDVNGNPVTLSTIISEKPALLLWGMYTCPAFQGLGTTKPFDKCSYQHEYELVEKYKDSVTVIHLVGPEPHPTTPDTNFDSGKQLMNYWSTVRQPKTYAARLLMTKKIQEFIHPDALLVPDNLSSAEGAPNQGVWCTMGLGARTAMLIGTDGLLKYKEDWFNSDDTAKAIDAYLNPSSVVKEDEMAGRAQPGHLAQH